MAIKITDPKIRVTMINDKVRMYLLPPLFNAAVRAGASIMRVYKNLDDYDISLKDDKTPITLADRVAHKTIREYLGPTRIPILSEEGRKMRYEERRNWELYWLVDPLDGTVEFIKGNNEFTVNIALMENNVCMGAVIYVPYFEKMYIAGRDSGSYLKEHIARTPQRTDARDFEFARTDPLDADHAVARRQRGEFRGVAAGVEHHDHLVTRVFGGEEIFNLRRIRHAAAQDRDADAVGGVAGSPAHGVQQQSFAAGAGDQRQQRAHACRRRSEQQEKDRLHARLRL